jgi:hypothetical protein
MGGGYNQFSLPAPLPTHTAVYWLGLLLVYTMTSNQITRNRSLILCLIQKLNCTWKFDSRVSIFSSSGMRWGMHYRKWFTSLCSYWTVMCLHSKLWNNQHLDLVRSLHMRRHGYVCTAMVNLLKHIAEIAIQWNDALSRTKKIIAPPPRLH